jgi:hypothetical protein
MFQRNASPPSSWIKSKPSKKSARTRLQAEQIEAIHSSKMPVDFAKLHDIVNAVTTSDPTIFREHFSHWN